MNLIYAEIIEVFSEGGMRLGKVRVGGAMKKIVLDLLTDVRSGEKVLVCDGVALSKVVECTEVEVNDVPGNPR
jgi:hydrogenase maturation factor